MNVKTCVYDIVFNGSVLYVGITKNPKTRYWDHRSTGTAPEGSELVVHRWYPSRKKAWSAEKKRQDDLEHYCGAKRGLAPYLTNAEIDEYVELVQKKNRSADDDKRIKELLNRGSKSANTKEG